ncbi:hypothetical protein LPJ60_006668, partial [Coemansia sp. RSA 2675]
MARTVVSAGASHQRRTAAALFDTAILVHRRLGEAQLETSVSCPRATFVTVPDRGLLLVSIHGPFKRVNEFHDDIVAAIERYQNNGWMPIIGGDFNIAPFPGDRATDAVNAEETAHWDIIPNYEQILNVRDYAHYAAPPPPPLSEPYSFTNPRSNLFTFKQTNGVNVPKNTYTARVDVILLPLSLLSRPGIMYDAIDQGTESDHAELRLSLPVSTASHAPPVHRPYVVAHDQCSKPQLIAAFEIILGKYEEHGMFDKPASAEHFSYYSSLLDEIRSTARADNKRNQRSLRKEIEKLYTRHAQLFNEN